MAHSYTRVIGLLAAATLLPGCAPYIGSCTWVVPGADNSVKVVEARAPTAGECECIGCDAPGRFLLERDGYTLEFWNGDRWYGELYLRARSKDGEVLVLSSDSDELRRMAPHVPQSATHGYEYFMRFETEDSKGPVRSLRLSVVDPEGRVLGVEDIRLRVESRKDLQVETL